MALFDDLDWEFVNISTERVGVNIWRELWLCSPFLTYIDYIEGFNDDVFLSI